MSNSSRTTTPTTLVFSAAKKKSYHLVKELERKLNAALLHIDVLHVHGSLDKHEKFWFIQIFCAQINVAELIAHISKVPP